MPMTDAVHTCAMLTPCACAAVAVPVQYSHRHFIVEQPTYNISILMRFMGAADMSSLNEGIATFANDSLQPELRCMLVSVFMHTLLCTSIMSGHASVVLRSFVGRAQVCLSPSSSHCRLIPEAFVRPYGGAAPS